ncbi:hypothetical protein D3C86_1905810 [compost metagenome]
MPGNGPEHLVLHLLEEQAGGLAGALVIHGSGVEIANLLVEALLAGADLADALQQLVEVVPAAGVLQALVVHDEAFDQQLAQLGGGPLAKLRATR